MRGLNTMVFNQSTAEEAFEEYLNKRLTGVSEVKVTNVSYKSPGQYEVVFEDKKQEQT